MNIEGKKDGRTMVRFLEPSEYFFGTNPDKTGEQLGIYNRHMVSVRVQRLPPEKLWRMHEFFLSLRDREGEKKAAFHIALGPFINLVRRLLPLRWAETGNCAFWTSRFAASLELSCHSPRADSAPVYSGMVEAGVLTRRSIWPKSIFIDLFENANRTSAGGHDNVRVVNWRRVSHVPVAYGVDADTYLVGVAPLQSLRSLWYFDLSRFAHATVHVPGGSMRAVVTAQVRATPRALPPARDQPHAQSPRSRVGGPAV